MRQAQAEFDERAGPLCPSQLTAPVLHKVGAGMRAWPTGEGGASPHTVHPPLLQYPSLCAPPPPRVSRCWGTPQCSLWCGAARVSVPRATERRS